MINTGNIKVYSLPDVYEKVSSDEVVKLREQMYDLQLEVDILKETSVDRKSVCRERV